MYYEAIEHKELKANSVAEASRLIFEGKAKSFEAISWESDKGKFFAVSDAHIDDSPFAETAIVKQIGNKDFVQVESITVAWLKSAESVEAYFEKAETSQFNNPTQLLFAGSITNEKAWFQCGCCGEGFISGVKYQQKFDQDAGFGICPKCEKFYI